MMLLQEANLEYSKNRFPHVDNDVFETTALEVTWEVSRVFLLWSGYEINSGSKETC